MTPTPSFRDVERLSAYLDGQLKPSEMARLEARLQTEPELASVLNDLRQARGILRQLPQRRAPRNFTLTPKMVGHKPPMPRSYPIFRMATVLATLLLFFTFATNFMAPRLVRSAAPVAYGIGGGGNGAPAERPQSGGGGAPATEAPMPMMEAAPAATEAPSGVAPIAPAPTSMAPAASDSTNVEPTAQAFEKNGVPQPPPGETLTQQTAPQETQPTRAPAPPINASLQIILAGIAILSGIIAFSLRYSAIRKWRTKVK